jgi:hypothetical protein
MVTAKNNFALSPRYFYVYFVYHITAVSKMVTGGEALVRGGISPDVENGVLGTESKFQNK